MKEEDGGNWKSGGNGWEWMGSLSADAGRRRERGREQKISRKVGVSISSYDTSTTVNRHDTGMGGSSP